MLIVVESRAITYHKTVGYLSSDSPRPEESDSKTDKAISCPKDALFASQPAGGQLSLISASQLPKCIDLSSSIVSLNIFKSLENISQLPVLTALMRSHTLSMLSSCSPAASFLTRIRLCTQPFFTILSFENIWPWALGDFPEEIMVQQNSKSSDLSKMMY